MFHSRFPKRLRVEWLRAIGRDPRTFINQQRICSEHFLDTDYVNIGSLRKLKPNAIPSVNLPQSTLEAVISEVPPDDAEALKRDAVRAYIESLPSTSQACVMETQDAEMQNLVQDEGPSESKSSASTSTKRRMIKTFHSYR